MLWIWDDVVFYAFLRSQVHRHHLVFYSFLCYRSNSITIYTDLNWLMASHTHILYNMLGGGGSLFLGVLTFFLIIFWLIHITRMTVIGIKSRNFNQPYRRACYALFMYVLFIFISFHTYTLARIEIEVAVLDTIISIILTFKLQNHSKHLFFMLINNRQFVIKKKRPNAVLLFVFVAVVVFVFK